MTRITIGKSERDERPGAEQMAEAIRHLPHHKDGHVAVLRDRRSDAAENTLAQARMAIGPHDDHVTAELERMLADHVFRRPLAARDLLNHDLCAMTGQEGRHVRAWLSAILEIR